MQHKENTVMWEERAKEGCSVGKGKESENTLTAPSDCALSIVI